MACHELELELELILSHMTQKPMLRGGRGVGALARTNRTQVNYPKTNMEEGVRDQHHYRRRVCPPMYKCAFAGAVPTRLNGPFFYPRQHDASHQSIINPTQGDKSLGIRKNNGKIHSDDLDFHQRRSRPSAWHPLAPPRPEAC